MLDSASVNNRQLASPMSFLSDPLSSDPLCPPSPSERLGMNGEQKRLLEEEMQTDGTKRRRLNGGADSWLNNGTIIEEDLTEGLSEDGAGTRESLESLGERRRATLVNRDALFYKLIVIR